MSEPGAGAVGAGSLVRRALGAVGGRAFRQIGVVVAGVAVAVTAVSGGFEASGRTDRGLVPLELGSPVALGPVEVTVRHARYADELEGQTLRVEGNRWLAVVAVLEATDDRTVGSLDLDATMRLVDVDGLVDDDGRPVPAAEARSVRPTDLVYLDDGLVLSSAQPGIAYDVVYLWELDADAPLPDEVEVVLVATTKRESALDRQLMWLDPRDAAAGPVPLEAAAS